MTDQGLHRLLAAAIFLFVSAQEAQADALSSLPGDLAGKLEALATVATDTLIGTHATSSHRHART